MVSPSLACLNILSPDGLHKAWTDHQESWQVPFGKRLIAHEFGQASNSVCAIITKWRNIIFKQLKIMLVWGDYLWCQRRDPFVLFGYNSILFICRCVGINCSHDPTATIILYPNEGRYMGEHGVSSIDHLIIPQWKQGWKLRRIPSGPKHTSKH